jgi:DMSO/TMAO reductase YedYZ molybdopterin-dependent catalytic subunit
MVVLFLASCAAPPSGSVATSAPISGMPTKIPTRPAIPPEACHPDPVIAPTKPAVIPSLDEVDDVGLHVTNAIRAVELDPARYLLSVTGLVENPMELTLDDLRCMPKVTATVNLTCKGFFEDVTTYSGVPLQYILRQARLKDGAKGVRLNGADGYPSYVPLVEALQADNFLAYEWKDQPLPVLHGFPVRAVIPGMLGYAWAKYLLEISIE